MTEWRTDPRLTANEPDGLYCELKKYRHLAFVSLGGYVFSQRMPSGFTLRDARQMAKEMKLTLYVLRTDYRRKLSYRWEED